MNSELFNIPYNLKGFQKSRAYLAGLLTKI